jgi:hypothetical protein
MSGRSFNEASSIMGDDMPRRKGKAETSLQKFWTKIKC